MAYTKLIPHFTSGANVEEYSSENNNKAYRLSIPAGAADKYRLAQLDDYTKTKRGQFPLRPPIRLGLSARVSSRSIPGTWGFGLWNDPFGLSLGFSGNPFRLPTLPNAVWFFGASKESYLSFRSEFRPERSGAQSKGSASTIEFDPSASNSSAPREEAANGFLAQTFRSPKFHPWLIPAGLALPFSRKVTRRALGKVIEEDGVQLWSPTARRRVREHTLSERPALQTQSLDVTQWHKYQLDWHEDRVSFKVDDALTFESRVSPNAPLGLVIWIDNQYAAFTPEGKIGFGVLENPEPAWLEIKDINVVRDAIPQTSRLAG